MPRHGPSSGCADRGRLCSAGLARWAHISRQARLSGGIRLLTATTSVPSMSATILRTARPIRPRVRGLRRGPGARAHRRLPQGGAPEGHLARSTADDLVRARAAGSCHRREALAEATADRPAGPAHSGRTPPAGAPPPGRTGPPASCAGRGTAWPAAPADRRGCPDRPPRWPEPRATQPPQTRWLYAYAACRNRLAAAPRAPRAVGPRRPGRQASVNVAEQVLVPDQHRVPAHPVGTRGRAERVQHRRGAGEAGKAGNARG